MLIRHVAGRFPPDIVGGLDKDQGVNIKKRPSPSLFRDLHVPGHPLLLANAWDVASALVTEAAGAPAVATTSAGLAWAAGYPDGNRLPRALAVDATSRIVSAMSVPVTADIEGGFGDTPEEVARSVGAFLDAGVAGINIEDGTLDPVDLARRISAARSVAAARGVDLFINARTDVFLAGGDAPDQLLAEAVSRARLYVEAGADGVFVPGAAAARSIAALAESIPVPVNIMAGPGSLSVGQLGTLGVARVSLGSSVAQSAYALAASAYRGAAAGDYSVLEAGLPYGELNGLVASARRTAGN